MLVHSEEKDGTIALQLASTNPRERDFLASLLKAMIDGGTVKCTPIRGRLLTMKFPNELPDA